MYVTRGKLRILSYICVVLVLASIVHYLVTTSAILDEVKWGKGIFTEENFKVIEARRGCIIPKLDLYNPVYDSRKGKVVPDVVCDKEPDWLVTGNGSVAFAPHVLEKYGRIKCVLTYLQRKDDFIQNRGKSVALDSKDRKYIALDSDFFWVECSTKEGPTKTWSNLMAGIHVDADVLNRASVIKVQETPPKLNVLVFGFDSVSRLNFMRRLPKLYKYLTEDLGGVVLQNYNIVGDGTTAAILGAFAGKYETELPETRRGHSGSTTVDVYPFIWNNLSANGYVTAYAEDESSIGTFQYRLNGFREQPTTHYMRPFHLQVEKEHSKHRPYCLGSTPKIKVLMSWLQQIFEVYPNTVPKFVFGFHSEYSHGLIEELHLADDPVTEWLTNLSKSGLLDNTLLAVMSDHGHRFSFTRETLQGKYEERLPFYSIVAPKWFREKYPVEYNNLQVNARDRLTTPFDIHATFASILSTVNNGLHFPLKHTNITRGMNLFQEIPIERTCGDAEISLHWCSCLNWQKLDTSGPLARKASQAIVDAINALLKDHSDCLILELLDIKRAQRMIPTKEMLAFKESSDHDGYVPDLTGNTKVVEIFFDIQLTTKPNNGLYEATAKYLVLEDTFVVEPREISRVNLYGRASHCIATTFPHLNKFCFCKNQKSAGNDSYLNVIMG